MPVARPDKGRARGLHRGLLDLDPATRWLYAPRTISILLSGIALLVYFARVFDPTFSPTDDPVAAQQQATSNAKCGVWAAIFMFLCYSIVQGPRTSMIRPHPAVWRLAHGVIVVYMLFLVYMLFQTVDDARLFLKHLSPELGALLQERDYAQDCNLYVPGKGINWDVIRPTLLDEFVVAHILGWWGKALVLRNYLLLWCASLLFEALELTFQHYLPNFGECWWDRWLLDVMMCNLAGIVTGMWTVRYFQSKYENYNWQGVSQLPSFYSKARRGLLQLLPYSWDTFNWLVFSSPKRLLQSIVPVIVVLGFDMNVFFLKSALWIPPANPLNTCRLIIWFLMALPGIREYYEFIDGKSGNKLGIFAWSGIACTLLETLISIKFSHGLYHAPFPRVVVLAWSVGAAGLATALLLWQITIWLRKSQAVKIKKTQ